MCKYLVLTTLLVSCVFGLWMVEVDPFITGTDCYVGDTDDFCFGAAPEATDFFDIDHDVSHPPYPPDARIVQTFFALDDPLVQKVFRDIRDEDADTLYWDFHFVYGGVGTLTGYGLMWDPSELPTTGEFRIAVQLDTSHVLLKTLDQPRDSIIWELADDMRSATEISVTAPDVFYSHPVIRYIRSTASTDEKPLTPTALTLTAHPNPFNSAVEIDAPDGYSVTITDTDGRHVATLGTGSNRWTPAEGQPSGVYIVKAEGDGESLTQRIVYMK